MQTVFRIERNGKVILSKAVFSEQHFSDWLSPMKHGFYSKMKDLCTCLCGMLCREPWHHFYIIANCVYDTQILTKQPANLVKVKFYTKKKIMLEKRDCNSSSGILLLEFSGILLLIPAFCIYGHSAFHTEYFYLTSVFILSTLCLCMNVQSFLRDQYNSLILIRLTRILTCICILNLKNDIFIP